MLQIQTIRDNKEDVILALGKRNIDAEPLIEKVLQLDENRRAAQTSLDNVLAESNKISKEIGVLYKTGKVQEANLLKEQTVKLKEESKQLGEDLNTAEEELQTLLYQLPNAPHATSINSLLFR